MIPKGSPILTDRFELMSCLKREVPGILAKYPVMLAYLFGSVVDGSATPFSDIDIALVLEPGLNLTPYERMHLEFNIAAELERRCNVQEADVRSVDSAPMTVQGLVLSEGVLLYSRDEEFRVEYEIRTRKRYFDFSPVIEMMRAAFFEVIQKEGLTGGKTR